MSRTRKGMECLVVTAVVFTTIAASGGFAFARPASAGLSCTGSWTMDASPSRSGLNVLDGVWAASADDVWAVGDNRRAEALVLHHTTTGWHIVDVPSYGTSAVLRSISGAAPDNVWAVGFTQVKGRDQVLTMHWNGSSWRRFTAPARGVSPELWGVSSGTSRPTWAVGYAGYSVGRDVTQIFRREKGSWVHVHSPNPFDSDYLKAVRSVSPTLAWAVGWSQDNIYHHPLVERWDGASWTAITDPAVAGVTGRLLAVTTPSPTTMVAVGEGVNGPIVVTYDGATWSSTYLVDVTGDLNGVAPDGNGGVWAVGDDNASDDMQTVVEHDSGTGFSRVSSPNPGVNDGFDAVTSRSGISWAVGYQTKATGDPHTLVAYDC